MTTDFISSFRWAQQWIPQIRCIIGPHLLRVGTLQEDAQESTDLIVLKAEGIRIACRVRRPGYAERFPFDITITCERENGSKCEWHKMILGGWSDWYFYCHAPELKPRYLLRLESVRPWMISMVNQNRAMKARNKDANGHGCFFYSFDVRQMPPSAVIASNPKIQML